MKELTKTISKFDTKSSIKRAGIERKATPHWSIKVPNGEYVWSNKMERVGLIRKGLPYESIEVISKRTGSPVKQVLTIFGVPQTTYNKKKRENDLLSGRDSEVVLLLTELLDFGLEAFNNEREKFQRWLKKPNLSLGGAKPESLFDSVTGIQEVKNALNRLEYGNMA
ncbi:MAG: antitoxin Xre/MbcA/ParS toxin-binding domain-containing protein [Imperialibacter sp.]|uniref:type II RES/Xre toxin-antitoxin system antitoxin n=1 Tax=Imperialibacter sp. TaxID=2038411 RepID=UPI003A8C82D8